LKLEIGDFMDPRIIDCWVAAVSRL